MTAFKPEWDFFKLRVNFYQLWKHLFKLQWVFKLQMGLSKCRTVFKPGVDFLKLQRRVKLRRDCLKLQVVRLKLHWVLRKWVGMPEVSK